MAVITGISQDHLDYPWFPTTQTKALTFEIQLPVACQFKLSYGSILT